MSEKVYCLAIYELNGHYLVRKCCDVGYRMHGLEELRLPQCTCEIVERGLTKAEALTIGSNLSKKLRVSLRID